MNTKQFLEAAKAKIDSPEKWVKDSFARDAKGFPVNSQNPMATCFCMTGALMRVGVEVGGEDFPYASVYGDAYQKLFGIANNLSSKRFDGLARFNDHHLTTHQDVMRVFDQAIAECKDGN